MPLYIIGLGSNIGDSKQMLAEAIRELATQLDAIEYSPVYTSPALLPDGAPREWDRPFLNMALRGTSALEPEEMLRVVKSIEAKVGRQDRGHWGPREIDLDILACDDRVVETEALTIPHRGLLERDFALKPLSDIAPGWRYPRAGEHHGKTAMSLLQQLGFGQTEHFRPLPISLPMLR